MHSPETHRWYFLELSWDRRNGLKMYVDLDLVDSDSSPVIRVQQQVDADRAHAYVGADTTRSNYGSATIHVDEWSSGSANEAS